MNLTTLHSSRIVVFRRLHSFGSAHSLLCVVNRCEKDTQSFSLRSQVIRPTFRRRRKAGSNGGREAQNSFPQPTQKGHLVVSFALVAEVGFEPHDLRVMSPTSYQAALLRDIKFYRCGAGDRGRTGTILSYHGILSPGRLPVPPHRRTAFCRLLRYYIILYCLCQPFFSFPTQNFSAFPFFYAFFLHYSPFLLEIVKLLW